MQHPLSSTAAIAFLLASGLAMAGSNDTLSHVEYQGHKVVLTKSYADFRDYKDDPENLSQAQAKLASSLVRKAKFGPRFRDSDELLAALDALQFPGYGYFFANQVGAKLDSKLEVSFVELPKSRANRYLITEIQSDGTYLVVADFIAPSEPEITRVARGSDGKLQYRGAGGRAVVPK